MRARGTWIVVGVAVAIGGVVGYRCTRGGGRGAAVAIDAGAARAPAIDAPPAPPQPDTPVAGGLGVTVRDDATSAPAAATLTAIDDAGRRVDSSVGANGQGALAIGPGAWTVEARTPAGELLAQPRGARWQVGPAPPPWVELRVAAMVDADAPPPPPRGTGTLHGVATLDGARAADLVVIPIFLGGFGPGHAVTHDRVPQPIVLPTRRFVGTAGAWRLDELPDGGYAAIIVAPWRGAALIRATVANGLAGDGTAALAASIQLSGSVLDQRGAEVAGATVRVLAGALELGRVTTDARGAFRLYDLPAGELTVDARAPSCYGERKAETLAPGTDARFNLAIVCDDAAVPPP